MKNMTKISMALTVLFTTCSYFNSVAQSSLDLKKMEIYLKVAPNDTSNLYGKTEFADNTQLTGTMFIRLNDTLGIAKVHVKLGTTDGSGNLLTKAFLFNETGDFSDGTSYKRSGKTIYIGLGNFVGLNTFYSEVKLEGTNGNFGSAKKYDKPN